MKALQEVLLVDQVARERDNQTFDAGNKVRFVVTCTVVSKDLPVNCTVQEFRVDGRVTTYSYRMEVSPTLAFIMDARAESHI